MKPEFLLATWAVVESSRAIPASSIRVLIRLGPAFKVEARLVRTIRREASSLVYDSFKMRNRAHE